MKKCLTLQDVDDFVSSLEQIWINECTITSLAHQWILCSESTISYLNNWVSPTKNSLQL